MKYIKIRTCHECPHKDHDGGLRPGGAYQVCGLMKVDAVEAHSQEGVRRRRLNPDAPPVGREATMRRFDGVIPKWCPL